MDSMPSSKNSAFFLLGIAGLSFGQSSGYVQKARAAFPPERFLIQAAAGSDAASAESTASKSLGDRLESILTNALERSRQSGKGSGLARSAAHLENVPVDWQHWVRVEPQWTSQADGRWQAVAVVPLADIRSELERRYEEQAVPFRTVARQALAAASLPAFLETARSAQPHWTEMVRQALYMACTVPSQEEGAVSLTAVLSDDRKHPYAPWQTDQELHSRLRAAVASRFKAVKVRSQGDLARKWASESVARLSRSGIPAVADKAGPCRSGLLLELRDRTECEDVSLGWRCQAAFSWDLQECTAHEARPFKQGELPALKAVQPRDERQSRQELAKKAAAAGLDSLLVESLKDAIPDLTD